MDLASLSGDRSRPPRQLAVSAASPPNLLHLRPTERRGLGIAKGHNGLDHCFLKLPPGQVASAATCASASVASSSASPATILCAGFSLVEIRFGKFNPKAID